MNTDPFDKLFSDKLAGYESPADTGAIWAGVQQRMGGPVRGGFAWWLAGALVLIFFAGFALWWWLPSGNAEVAQTYQTTRAQASSENEEILQPDVPRIANLSEKMDTQASPNTEVLKPEVSSTASLSENIHAQTNTLENSRMEQSSPVQASASQSLPNVESTFQEGAPAKSAPGYTQSNDAVYNKSENRPIADTEKTNQGDASTNPVNPLIQNAFSTPSGNSTADLNPEIFGMPYAMTPLSTGSLPALAGPPHFWIPEGMPSRTPFAERRPSVQGLYLMADAGAGLTYRSLEAAAEPLNDYTRTRERHERPLEYLSGQARLSYRFDNGLYLSSGIAVMRIREQFSLNRTLTNQEVVPVINEIHVDQAGDSTFVYGLGTITTTHSQRVEHTNTYTLIDVPISVGYFWRTGRWNIGTEAGLMLNLNLSSHGRILQPDGALTPIETSGMYRNNAGISYTGAAWIGYQVTERMQLYITPVVRFIPGSILNADVMLRQRYTLVGANAGIAYRLW